MAAKFHADRAAGAVPCNSDVWAHTGGVALLLHDSLAFPCPHACALRLQKRELHKRYAQGGIAPVSHQSMPCIRLYITPEGKCFTRLDTKAAEAQSGLTWMMMLAWAAGTLVVVLLLLLLRLWPSPACSCAQGPRPACRS